jgi:hypothetical protein
MIVYGKRYQSGGRGWAPCRPSEFSKVVGNVCNLSAQQRMQASRLSASRPLICQQGPCISVKRKVLSILESRYHQDMEVVPRRQRVLELRIIINQYTDEDPPTASVRALLRNPNLIHSSGSIETVSLFCSLGIYENKEDRSALA